MGDKSIPIKLKFGTEKYTVAEWGMAMLPVFQWHGDAYSFLLELHQSLRLSSTTEAGS